MMEANRLLKLREEGLFPIDMVSSQLSGGAPMRYTHIIGSQADYVQHQSIKPKHYPCPQCGKKGKRKHVITRRIAHVAALQRRSWIVAEVGV
jgi:hypothetical protein